MFRTPCIGHDSATRCISFQVKAMALLERTRRSFLERNPSAGADGRRARCFFLVVFFCSDGMMEQ